MTALWTSPTPTAATGGRAGRAWQASGVSIDSRTLEPGDLFVALVGPTSTATISSRGRAGRGRRGRWSIAAPRAGMR